MVLTLSAAILSMLSIHLLPLLQARGLELSAVGLGAIVGPSQVGARVVEMSAGRHYRPIWTMMALQISSLYGRDCVDGAGNGIASVAPRQSAASWQLSSAWQPPFAA
jgi:hypothetical protein